MPIDERLERGHCLYRQHGMVVEARPHSAKMQGCRRARANDPSISRRMEMTMQRIYVECPDGDLEGFVDLNDDLDGRFKLIDDDGEVWSVNGWTCHIEIIEDYPERF